MEIFLQEHPYILQSLQLATTAVLTLALLLVVLRVERKLLKKVLARRKNINLVFVERILRFIVIFIAVQWVVMSSPLTQPFGRVIFQGTTIIGAIAGLAAQPVLADMICGMMISATKPFDIGDRIELEDGTAGIVKDITVRHVVIQTIDTIQRVIPNSKLNAMMIQNMSYHTTTRSVHFRFQVSYKTDLNLAKKVISKAVKESPYTIAGQAGRGYTPVYFFAFNDSSLELGVTVYFEPVYPSERVKDDINSRVRSALMDAGIEIPYSYVNVVMSGEDDGTVEAEGKSGAEGKAGAEAEAEA